MVDRVQAKGSLIEPSLFHFSFTKLLLIKELDKKEQSWQEFLISSGWITQPYDSQRTKKNTLSVAVK